MFKSDSETVFPVISHTLTTTCWYTDRHSKGFYFSFSDLYIEETLWSITDIMTIHLYKDMESIQTNRGC